jgi:hypothetical protein
MAENGQGQNGGLRPVPDPTVLTTDLINQGKADIRRELLAQRELLERALDDAHALRVSEHASIQRIMDERERSSKEAVSAAFAAAKELVAQQNQANLEAATKAEIGTQKQIDGLTALMSTAIKAAEDKIADLKERLDWGEGGSTGARAAKELDDANSDRFRSTIIAVGALIVSLGGVIAIIAFHGH